MMLLGLSLTTWAAMLFHKVGTSFQLHGGGAEQAMGNTFAISSDMSGDGCRRKNRLTGCILLEVTMKTLLSVLIVLALFALAPAAGIAADTLQQAQQLVEQQRYDDAISVLRTLTAAEPENAEAAVALARAYHWKKDFPDAKKWYQRAATLDARYRLEIVGLLDEADESEEVVLLVRPEFDKGNREPSLLGSLLSAYERMGRKTDRKAVEQALIDARYDHGADRDYRHYILAYCALYDGDRSSAISHLKQIVDRGYRVYARTSPKFAILKGDPDFEQATQ